MTYITKPSELKTSTLFIIIGTKRSSSFMQGHCKGIARLLQKLPARSHAFADGVILQMVWIWKEKPFPHPDVAWINKGVNIPERAVCVFLRFSADVFWFCHCSIYFLPIRQNRDRFTGYSYTRTYIIWKTTFWCFFGLLWKKHIRRRIQQHYNPWSINMNF